MATRIHQYKIEAKGGILIPAGAGVGKYGVSDASGNFEWITKPKVKTSDVHAWSVVTAAVEELPGLEVEPASGETLFLVAVRVRSLSGESEVEVKRNGAGVVSLKELKVKSGEGKKTEANGGTPVELAAGDYFTLNVKTVGAKGMMVTLVLRSEV